MPKLKKSKQKKAAPIQRTASLPLPASSMRAEQYAQGKALRDKCPRQAHGGWSPPPDRADPLQLLAESNRDRIPELIPIRYGRMLHSPFAFYRGAALNMAADLATMPISGLRAQVCGDCHLLNFGYFATPERREIFDINDFDETLPAPWEWDVKRLTTSFVLAARNNRHSEDDARGAALACARSYREHMAEFSQMHVLDVWYSSIDVASLLPTIHDRTFQEQIQKRLAKARERGVMEHDFLQMVSEDGGEPTIKDSPPLIYHPHEKRREEYVAGVEKAFAEYRDTLPEHRRQLLDRYKTVDIAMKVVGVGSVGTACSIVLLTAGGNDSLFLQIKEARASVLEAYAGQSAYPNHGERVVVGSQLMQAASDMFLGWTEGVLGDTRHYYVRQLKDLKIKPLVEVYTPSAMKMYAGICGWTLARAHARSGEPSQISGYLGKGDKFDEAIADFAVAYADQTEQDHEVFTNAVRDGKIEVIIEQA